MPEAGGAPWIITACGDAGTLARVQGRIFADAWRAETLAALLATPGVAAALARQGEREAGLAIWRVAADEGEIITLGVVPGAVGQGIGGDLTRTACAWMRLRGCRTVFLEVACDNEAAKRLYRGAGFEIVGLRKRYYGNRDGTFADAAIMRLTL